MSNYSFKTHRFFPNCIHTVEKFFDALSCHSLFLVDNPIPCDEDLLMKAGPRIVFRRAKGPSAFLEKMGDL